MLTLGPTGKELNNTKEVATSEEGRRPDDDEQPGDNLDTNDDNHKCNNRKDVLEYFRKIVGIYLINDNDIAKNMFEEEKVDNTVMIRTVEEYLHKELGFRLEQIVDFGVTIVKKSRKEDTLYLHMKNEPGAFQIFRRAAIIANNDLKITNYGAPQLF